MKTNPPILSAVARPRNIIISGTNFWNPGDDFVRDGVIGVLRETFSGEPLNFLFYNFNADFFPQDKFAGIGNYLAKGDLEKYRDFVDAIVIAGLSAGDEIKDLYRWVVANGLAEKVCLIGAGYENDYVARNIAHEPEATIFRQARIVIGRTARTPEFIQAGGIPYHHLNCPAILSVPEVKLVPAGKPIERIGFSIQLPHGDGLANQSCDRKLYELAVSVLRDLARDYAVEVVAHHKTEYFHFLHLLRGENIPVIFSSFYQDLHQIYPRYDLVITTRLHSSLFANGHGIPGIVLNDTDRHTHTLDGFEHSTWVCNRESFDQAFSRWTSADLAAVARELENFKADLLAAYLAALRPVMTSGLPASSTNEAAQPQPVGLGCNPQAQATVPATLPEPKPENELPAVSVFGKNLPVHFFTIVLNGQPFIRHHIEAFKNLPFAWHWHIVEGVAELNHDTGWSKATGGKIPDQLHRGGLSLDGTTEYLDALQKEFPENVTLYRLPAGKFWDGKCAMVNAPLANLGEDALLWQVDADELWTYSQIIRARALFLAHPEKTAALFYCHYFVGPDLVVASRNTYGNYEHEWLRIWRYQPGDRWATHEPPRLCRGKLDLASINPFRHAETEAMGLVFQHFAYATEAQLRFKESYYGYAGAVAQWRKLQQAETFPLNLSDFFAWVKDAAVVNTAASLGLNRLAPDGWFGLPVAKSPGPLDAARRILFVRTDSIGDAVLASAMLEPLRRQNPRAQLAVLCQHHVADLYTACPFVDSIICYDAKKMDILGERQQILDEIAAFSPDLILNSIRSRERLSDELTLSFPGARHIAIAGDLNNTSEAVREAFRRHYELVIPTPDAHRAELERHADFLRGLGIAASRLNPVVWTSPENEALADAFFEQQQLNPARTIALFPGAQYQMRIYHHYADAVKHLHGFRFLIFGDATQNPLAEELEQQLPGRTINLCGCTTLRETAALLRRCRLYLGAESAGAHIACAVGVPNVVLLGGGHFGRFMPYSPLTSAVVLPLDCFGCNWRCRYDSAHCIANLTPEVVKAAVTDALKAPRQKPAIFAQMNDLESTGLHLPPALAAWLNPEAVDFVPVAPDLPASGDDWLAGLQMNWQPPVDGQPKFAACDVEAV
jgi:ADP-heptose:LPS heptosyltransferase